MKASHKSVSKVAAILIKSGLDHKFDKMYAMSMINEFVYYGRSIINMKEKEVRDEIKFILNRKSFNLNS